MLVSWDNLVTSQYCLSLSRLRPGPGLLAYLCKINMFQLTRLRLGILATQQPIYLPPHHYLIFEQQTFSECCQTYHYTIHFSLQWNWNIANIDDLHRCQHWRTLESVESSYLYMGLVALSLNQRIRETSCWRPPAVTSHGSTPVSPRSPDTQTMGTGTSGN